MRNLVLVIALALAAGGCGGNGDGRGEPTSVAQAPFDRAFIDAMVPHHREAIEMAEAAKKADLTQPDLQKIADDIVASQQREIDQMLAWRERWFGSRKLGPIQPEALGVPESELGMEHRSAEEVANADDVDATFAKMMIEHHKGAIVMARAAQQRAQRDAVKMLAASIIEAQEREIRIMEKHASDDHHG